MSAKKDMTGAKYPHFVVLRETEPVGSRKKTAYLCLCECGNTFTTTGEHIRSEHTTSCGCQQKKRSSEANKTHGRSPKLLHGVWLDMKVRSGEIAPKSRKADCQAYIDKNIRLECEAWKKFEPFREWALSNGYREGLQIDRIDNNRGYCPENCRWVSRKENVNNRQCTLRLEDGTPLAMFCSMVGIETSENGKTTARYLRIIRAHHNGKAHPELVKAANQTILVMHQCLEMLNLLGEVKVMKRSISNI